MNKQPRLYKQLWHNLERYGFVGAFLFMCFCLMFCVVFVLVCLPKLAWACMSLAVVALFVVLFSWNEKEKK